MHFERRINTIEVQLRVEKMVSKAQRKKLLIKKSIGFPYNPVVRLYA